LHLAISTRPRRIACGTAFLVASRAVRDLLLCAKDLFVAAMAAIDPRIHGSSADVFAKTMDCRVKPGNDGLMPLGN